MPEAIAVEADTGAQLLPRANDPRQRMTSYWAHIACDADVRARSGTVANIAAQIKIMPALAPVGQELGAARTQDEGETTNE